MSQSLRKVTVLLLVLLWNSTAAYMTVCQVICAEQNAVQQVAQVSGRRVAQSSPAASAIANEPAQQDSQCAGNIGPGKCVAGSSQQLVPGLSPMEPLLAAAVPSMLLSQSGTDFHLHSPPSSPSGRSICSKLTLLRI